MAAILNSLNAHNLPIFQPILTTLVSKFMVHRALSDRTYLLLGLLSPLIFYRNFFVRYGLFIQSQRVRAISVYQCMSTT